MTESKPIIDRWYEVTDVIADELMRNAAPKILKALEDFLCHCPSGISPMLDEAKISARAAIKEAKGE